MNVHWLSGSWIVWVDGRSWKLTVHEFYQFLICFSGTFMNSSWTHLINVHECSLTIWFMNYLSSWPFMNNPSLFTKFLNRKILMNFHESFICCSRISMNSSWTLWWTFIVFCSGTFTLLILKCHIQFPRDEILFKTFHMMVKYDRRVTRYPAKLNNINFQPLEVVSRYRDPQLQVAENHSYFLIWAHIFTNLDV